jgi:hypothetical protein
MAERKAPELAIVDADLWQRVGLIKTGGDATLDP